MRLKSWQHRKLTLLGKSTAIKTLALPKLIHLLTSLPNLPQAKRNDLNSLFYNFIWNRTSFQRGFVSFIATSFSFSF
jgi:hypothetical protein